MRDMRLPDASRPVDHEAARAAIRPLARVRSSVWIDHSNLLVMVGGSQYRNLTTVDRVCRVLEPLGDTLAVVINVQDMLATTSEGADTLSRNCQLGAGERALFQGKRGLMCSIRSSGGIPVTARRAWRRLICLSLAASLLRLPLRG